MSFFEPLAIDVATDTGFVTPRAKVSTLETSGEETSTEETTGKRPNQASSQKERKKQRVTVKVLFDDRIHNANDKEYLVSCLTSLQSNERYYSIPRDYLLIPADVVIDREILLVSVDDTCREQMIDWAHELMEFCGFDGDTVAIAVNILDRYICATGAILQDRDHYQLVVMTCLYISVKVHERLALSSKQLADLSRGKFTPLQIEQLEVKICMALKWRFAPPTPWQYFRLLGGYSLTVDERRAVQGELGKAIAKGDCLVRQHDNEAIDYVLSRRFPHTTQSIKADAISGC